MEINKIYCESNLETMSRMADNFIDLTVTSPPYDNLRDYKGYSFPFEEIAKELYRVTKDGGIVVWIVSDAIIDGSKSCTSFNQCLFFKDIGFKIHDVMIWSKDTFTYPSKNRYRNTFEYMFILSKNSPKTFNPIIDKKNKWANTKVHGTSRNKKGDTFVKSNNNKTNVLDYGVRFNIWNNPTEKNSSMIKHPAMFPEKLVEDHILSWSNENDLVYDCFGGSGTTAKMAHKWKRNWILSEISKEYVEMAEKRIAPYLAQTFLF